MMKFLRVWGVGVFFSLALSTVALAEQYALLIGVSRYQELDNLINPVPDVRAVGEVLRQRYGFLPEVLENPTRNDILRALRSYAERSYRPEDQLLILFAGHGTWDEVTRLGYLAPSDAASRGRDPNFDSYLDFPKLLALIDNIPNQHVYLVVDACFSGSLEDEAHGVTKTARQSRAKTRRYLTSGGKEYVPDGDPDRHTPFVRALLEGLESNSIGDSIDIANLQERFMAKVEPRPRWGSFGEDEGGTFTFEATSTVRGPASTSVVVAGSARTVTAPTAVPSSPTASRLRSKPMRLTEGEIKRAFRRAGLFDGTWNPDDSFPNEFRSQTHDGWDVIADLESNLQWQQGGSDNRMSHTQALVWVADLNRRRHAGFGNWRLPTLEELASLLDLERLATGLFIHPYFDPLQETCWSSDRERSEGTPYYVSFATGRTVLAYGQRSAFVRAVRTP